MNYQSEKTTKLIDKREQELREQKQREIDASSQKLTSGAEVEQSPSQMPANAYYGYNPNMPNQQQQAPQTTLETPKTPQQTNAKNAAAKAAAQAAAKAPAAAEDEGIPELF